MKCYGWKGGQGGEGFFPIFWKARSKNAEVLACNTLMTAYVLPSTLIQLNVS